MMPIKDKTAYPSDWKAIGLRIRERDGWKCKWCGVAHNAIIERHDNGAYTHHGHYTTKFVWDTCWSGKNVVRIVLTVAHVNHDTTDNSDDNLAALCQRCHLRHDAQFHSGNAARTRRAKRIAGGQMEIDL